MRREERGEEKREERRGERRQERGEERRELQGWDGGEMFFCTLEPDREIQIAHTEERVHTKRNKCNKIKLRDRIRAMGYGMINTSPVSQGLTIAAKKVQVSAFQLTGSGF